MGNQALMQVAGEQGDGVRAGVVAEEMAGHADLAAAAFSEHLLIEPGPVLDFLFAGRLQTRKGDRHHGDFGGRTSVLVNFPPAVSGCAAWSVWCRTAIEHPAGHDGGNRSVSPGVRAEQVRLRRTLALGWLGFSSPPTGAVASGSGWRSGLPASAVAAIACGIEEVPAGLLESLGVAQCCWMPGLGWGSALQILSPVGEPVGLDWCHPA